MIELRQRERRAQLETLRLLLLRDGDGCEEGFLSRRHIRLIALEQNLAAKLIPANVELTIKETYGGLDATDFAILRAIREAIPDANSRSPAEVLHAPTLAERKGLFKTADRSRGKTPRGGRWSAERPLDPRAAIKGREQLAS